MLKKILIIISIVIVVIGALAFLFLPQFIYPYLNVNRVNCVINLTVDGKKVNLDQDCLARYSYPKSKEVIETVVKNNGFGFKGGYFGDNIVYVKLPNEFAKANINKALTDDVILQFGTNNVKYWYILNFTIDINMKNDGEFVNVESKQTLRYTEPFGKRTTKVMTDSRRLGKDSSRINLVKVK